MNLLLVQCRTDDSAPHEYGCIQSHTRLTDSQITVVNPVKNPGRLTQANLDEFDAAIVGGSGEFSLSHKENFEFALDEIRPFLDKVLEKEMPFLGMCLGHQILAWHLGARVEADPSQQEVGSFEVTLTDKRAVDPVFKDLPKKFMAQHGHQDSVMELPTGAVHLSSGVKNRIGGFRVGDKAYGLQFHPELTLDDLMTRLALYPEYLGGRTIDEARRDFKESPMAPLSIKNFFNRVVLSESPEVVSEPALAKV
ncbi:type 1 glutamine amidotransferase [Candidatus Berkelbacteria bacterium]|nr:type 1 glutamine amidotransferase [Candidatus Berkelbacteria bacterium]